MSTMAGAILGGILFAFLVVLNVSNFFEFSCCFQSNQMLLSVDAVYPSVLNFS